LLIHTKSYVCEFFSGSKIFQLKELEGKIRGAAVNQELTIMIARENECSPNLIIKLSNTKELKAY